MRRLHAAPAATVLAVSLTVFAAVVVAGCGRPASEATTDPAAAGLDPSAADPASPTTTVAPRKPLSRAQAAARYLEIVKPYNVALERLERGFNAGKPIGELRPLADAVARSNTTHIRRLRATEWPANVRAAVRQVIAESEAAQRYWRQAATASTRNELAEAANAAGRHNGSEPAAEIRKALGLGDYDEGDYGGGNP